MSPIALRLRQLEAEKSHESTTTVAPESSEATFTTTAFGTSEELRFSPPTTTLLPAHSTTTSTTSSTPTAEIWPDHAPDLPKNIVWILAGGLSFGFVAAICLVLINFWPRQPNRPQRRLKRKRQYHELPQGHVELESYTTSRTPITPDWHEGGRSPMLRRRERRPKNLSVDTNAQYHGLGIAVPGEAGSASTTSSSSSLHGKPSASLLETRQLLRSKDSIPRYSEQPTIRLHSPTVLRKSIHSKSVSETANGATLDLEAGTEDKHNRLFHNREEDSPPQTPYASPRVSPAISTLCLLLDKGEDAIDCVATKFARIMYQQVKEDPEDGLLLPVRSDERERGEGNGRMIEIS